MGDLLNSPALNYTLFTLADAVEQTRQLKLLQEQPEDDMDTSRTEEENKPAVSIEKQFEIHCCVHWYRHGFNPHCSWIVGKW